MTNSLIHVNGLNSLVKNGIHNVVLGIGVFDGLHLGHQELITRLQEMAKLYNATPAIMTFFPHPRYILRPHSSPQLLISPQKKIELLQDMGIQVVITLAFTKQFSELTPEEFVERVLISDFIEINGICVGRNWRFGAKGRGDAEFLKTYAKTGHIDCRIVEELKINGEVISSTAIRTAISSGLLEKARKMLGRNYSISGQVVHGKHIAGAVLAAPTANIDFEYGILPPPGVYAGTAIIKNRRYPSAISVSTAPTFRHGHPQTKCQLEAHIMDMDINLYDMNIEIEFEKYIRPERCYASSDELKKQIEQDIRLITEHFSKKAV